MSVTVEDFLEHHGVKGQKWGIRNRYKEGAKIIGRFVSSKEGQKKIAKVAISQGAGFAVGKVVQKFLIQHGGEPIRVFVASNILGMSVSFSIRKLLGKVGPLKAKEAAGGLQLHSDKILNGLYNRIAKLDMNNPNHVNKAMPLLDKILDRRIALKELRKEDVY